jgi:hypothetical protein
MVARLDLLAPVPGIPVEVTGDTVAVKEDMLAARNWIV